MIKWIRKNEKKVMALFAVVLMVMFIKGLVPNTGSGNDAASRVVATLGGTKVSQGVLSSFNRQWQTLNMLDYVDPNHPDMQPLPLLNERLGPQLANLIRQSQNSSESVPLFFLLAQEARQEGIIVDPEELKTYVTTYVQPLPAEGTDERDRVEEAVNNCLLIRHLLERNARLIKISRPYQQFALARTQQDLSVKIVPILASSYLSDVPAPSNADIKNQFDQYSDALAGEFGQQSNPLGFGYKIPNRVQVQFIGLKHSDVHDAAVASTSPRSSRWKVP